MANFEQSLNIEEKVKPESKERLTKEEIEKIVRDIKTATAPFYDTIEKIRKENPDREISGRIENGKLELSDESRWKKDCAIGDSYGEERKKAKEGAISFHTHADSDLTNESAQDILAACYRLKELIFHKDGVSLLVALKELPIEEIKKIDEQAWREAQKEEEKCGDSAYWFWKEKLKEKLPVRIIDILANSEKLKK